MMDVRQFIVAHDDDGIRLDRWFKRHMEGTPFALVSRWARTGQLRVDGKRAEVSDRIATGQVIRVPPIDLEAVKSTVKRRVELSPEDIALARSMEISRDETAILLNKLPGLATQGGSKVSQSVDGLLDAFIEDDRDPRPRLVHRLDKDTSGLLLIARTPGSAAYYSKHFAGRSARKTYWALVMGVPSIEDGMIELPVSKQPGTGGEKMHVDEENGQAAQTRYRVIDEAGNRCAFVELTPFTGRTHQLRVHMAAIGHPIVGDGKYGGKEAFLTGSISRKLHLHARRLRIGRPGGGKLDVRAELPAHFTASLASLGFDEEAGDALSAEQGWIPATPAMEKQQAKAHAKQVRKEKRGERRARGAAPPVKGPVKGKSAYPAKGKVTGKPPRPKTTPKSAPKKGKTR